MDKLKELLKNKKMVGIAGGIIALIVIILLVVFLILPNLGKSEAKVQKDFEGMLREMGKDFYENYYYDNLAKTDEERKDFLKKYQSIGIKIDLENLGRYNSNANKDKVAEFVNPTTNEACDAKNTKVIIYPKEGYSKTEYDMEIELDCGFEAQEEK